MAAIPAHEALLRLREGNRRFAFGLGFGGSAVGTPAERARLVDGQSPFAIVLGCSDSRVPAELVFDCGFGDLFVIRVAGNIVAPSQIASIEFAASAYGTSLVVVLGHSRCGAIQATIDALRRARGGDGRGAADPLAAIVDRVRPAVEPLLDAELGGRDDEELAYQAMRANVQASTRGIRTGSPALARLVAEERLLVVGAEYALESGDVRFFDGVPDETRSRLRIG
jgi:carbonic anhydrase